MNESAVRGNVVLVQAKGRGKRKPAAPEGPARTLSSPEEITEAVFRGEGTTYWVAAQGVSGELLQALAGGVESGLSGSVGLRRSHFIVVLDDLGAGRHALLDAVFRRVLVREAGVHLLPAEELVEVFASPRRDELFVGGVVNVQDEVVVLYRGSMEPLLVPTSWFAPAGDGTAPDFADFSIDDFGQTVRFGPYEAAADAILYEHDADYRRRARKRLRETDRSFGASLRRLRLQKGVRRDDFPGVSDKQVARIERGETGKPRPATLAKLAARLGVRPDEIEEY